MAALDLTLSITSFVYSLVEGSYSDVWLKDFKGFALDNKSLGYDEKEKSHIRDQLNLAAMIIDNTIIDTAMIAIAATGIGTGGPASIRLRQSGDIVIKAGQQKNLYAEMSQKVSVPVAINSEKTTAGIKAGLAAAKLLTGLTKFGLKIDEAVEKMPVFVEKL
jgi:hypothetical protein